MNGSQATVFLDDLIRTDARNGLPALASLMKREIDMANKLAYGGKPYYSWYQGGVSTFVGFDTNPQFRQVYCGRNYGNVAEAVYVHWSPAWGNSDFGQTWQTTQYDTTTANTLHYESQPVLQYPTPVQTDRIYSARGFVAPNAELALSVTTPSAPRLNAGVAYQQPQDLIDPSAVGSYVDSSGTVAGLNPYCGTQQVRQNGDVVGAVASATSSEVLRRLRVGLNDTIQWRRGQIGWSAIRPGDATVGSFIDFTTSKTNWRYIFDQAYGDAGAGFSNLTVPSITLPLYLSAPNLYTSIRVYVFVYAAMSGTTNTGTIAISNRDSTGTKTAPTAPTNPITISGTTFQWYPSVASATGASLNLATAPYFMGYTAGFYDRVALCAKSSGATDSVRIAAWTMIPIAMPH